MINSLNMARYFIVKAYQDGIEAEMTNMKVQKLLYYAQSLYLALYDQPLFEEEIFTELLQNALHSKIARHVADYILGLIDPP